jgi:hypothetical protein
MRRITHTLVAALAATAMAASTAAAEPVDRYDSPTSSLAGTTEKQDLRGEHAQDAARFNGQMPSRGTPPVYSYEAPKPSPVSAPAAKPTGGDTEPWLILAIGLGATGIVAGSAAAVTRRSRVRVPA